MTALPLITHTHPGALLAQHRGRNVSAAQFLRAAEILAERLPPASHVLNLCQDRYQFAVTLAAALLRGQCTLLPSTQTPELLRQLLQLAPQLCGVHDGGAAAALAPLQRPVIDISALHETASSVERSWRVPQIPAEQLAVLIFTSGSSGMPVPHAKRFGELICCVQAAAARLEPVSGGGCAVVATVPPQHMYGLESSVLLPLQSAGVLCGARPLFPADVAAELARCSEPRLLCSTPVHLRALLRAGITLPPVALILSATAPLSRELALEVEERFATPLWEIYGSTESGQIATRRTTVDQSWRLWPQVRLRLHEQCWYAQGGHIPSPTALADVLEPVDEQHFLLHGRNADLVNVAGKRSSLAYLSHQLNSIAGVQDAAFFLREASEEGLPEISRLAAVAVAPGLHSEQLLAALRERIDAVFLPRPLLLVAQLPRNDTGKLPLQALQALATAATSHPAAIQPKALRISADHPALAGHFPSRPIVPGVVLLDEVLHALRAEYTHWQVDAVKFHHPVLPGQRLQLQLQRRADGAQAFEVHSEARLVASGLLRPEPAASATGTCLDGGGCRV